MTSKHFTLQNRMVFLKKIHIFFRALSTKLQEMKHKIQTAVVDRVVEDFVDITTPLKQFTDSVLAPEGKSMHIRVNYLAN